VHWHNCNIPTIMLGYGWCIAYQFFFMTWHVLDHNHRKAMSHLCQESIVPPIRPQPQTIVVICCSWTQSSYVDFDINIEWRHLWLIHGCTNPHNDQPIYFSLTSIGPSMSHGNFQLQHRCLAQHMVDFEIQSPTCEFYVTNFPPRISKRH